MLALSKYIPSKPTSLPFDVLFMRIYLLTVDDDCRTREMQQKKRQRTLDTLLGNDFRGFGKYLFILLQSGQNIYVHATTIRPAIQCKAFHAKQNLQGKQRHFTTM